MHFKILVVAAFTLHICLHVCKATNLYRLFTIIFTGVKRLLWFIWKIIYTYIYIYIIHIIYIYNIYNIYIHKPGTDK